MRDTLTWRRPEITPLVLERDFPEIERLLAREEWPFVRTDLELSHRQPGAAGFVARSGGRFGGFFAAHAFGAIGYLDMMIVAPELRRKGIARPLYFATMEALERNGARSCVVHTTQDSARIIRALGFHPGRTFTLLRREPIGIPGPPDSAVALLGPEDRDAVLAHDAEGFGLRREAWIDGLLEPHAARIFGLRRHGHLAATLCLRPRRGDAWCLDLAHAVCDRDLAYVVTTVADRFRDRRLECFASTDGTLQRLLEGLGFSVPHFFKAIGPLVEWRRGPVGDVGTSPALQTLCWF
jgi:GNAT superfamily N-acetyltransferase